MSSSSQVVRRSTRLKLKKELKLKRKRDLSYANETHESVLAHHPNGWNGSDLYSKHNNNHSNEQADEWNDSDLYSQHNNEQAGGWNDSDANTNHNHHHFNESILSRMGNLSMDITIDDAHNNSDDDVLFDPEGRITSGGPSHNILVRVGRHYNITLPTNIAGIYEVIKRQVYRVVVEQDTTIMEHHYIQCECPKSFISHIMEETKSIPCNGCGVLLCANDMGYAAFSDAYTLGTGVRIICDDCNQETEAETLIAQLLDSDRAIGDQRRETNQALRGQQQQIISQNLQEHIPTPGVLERYTYETEKYERFYLGDTADQTIRIPMAVFGTLFNLRYIRNWYGHTYTCSKTHAVMMSTIQDGTEICIIEGINKSTRHQNIHINNEDKTDAASYIDCREYNISVLGLFLIFTIVP